ncbi:glutaredoxin [Thiohalorhabdus denitrificans]|uniref:Glutaredoxin n=1 Tax=Thiohalorhabdus denitrificans TaxID=381306 RepID=A0A0P9GHM6_9GAMM|nr:glutaredoxin 3 [Thiohalorhabdus denitrificans]KPV39510.1 glutaredoxin [Thiohalorhabdus denitrificans]SCY00250.1 glutaredoxin 3 [Thiohalorhabdus denitrificans]
MARVEMYATRICPYCSMADALLRSKGVEPEKTLVDVHTEERARMLERSGGRRTVPQIFINGQHIGGFDELKALDQKGGLDPLLAEAAAEK